MKFNSLNHPDFQTINLSDDENSIKIAYTIGNNQNTELLSYITDNKNSIITKSNENFREIIKIVRIEIKI